MSDGYCEGCGYHPESCVCRESIEAERDALRSRQQMLDLRARQQDAVIDALRAEVERLKTLAYKQRDRAEAAEARVRELEGEIERLTT